MGDVLVASIGAAPGTLPERLLCERALDLAPTPAVRPAPFAPACRV
jgi:hypothetical protein